MVKNRITICIPHWQVRDFITVCLRSIRKHSKNYDIEVIVVDNGSRDDSLDYLRSIPWIKLVERPEEVHTNWPRNVFTAWDLGLTHASGEFYLTMHTDVFVLSDNWLSPLLREIRAGENVAGSGAWKLYLQNPFYAFQKRITNYPIKKIKQFFGVRSDAEWKASHYPRDYCALYRRKAIVESSLQFTPDPDRGFPYSKGGGYSIAAQLWDSGFETRMISTDEMRSNIVHIAHGTAGVTDKKGLKKKRQQQMVEKRISDYFNQSWIKKLMTDDTLDL